MGHPISTTTGRRGPNEAFYRIFGDDHPWLREEGGLQAHVKVMRGEVALPHTPDGECSECAKVYKEQLALLKRKGILPYKILIGGPYPSLREMVRRSLRRLASW